MTAGLFAGMTSARLVLEAGDWRMRRRCCFGGAGIFPAWFVLTVPKLSFERKASVLLAGTSTSGWCELAFRACVRSLYSDCEYDTLHCLVDKGANIVRPVGAVLSEKHGDERLESLTLSFRRILAPGGDACRSARSWLVSPYPLQTRRYRYMYSVLCRYRTRTQQCTSRANVIN